MMCGSGDTEREGVVYAVIARAGYVVAIVCGLLLFAAPAGAATYAPLDRPGPRLSVPQATLDHAISCDAPLAGARRDVILVVPPTAFDPQEGYGWNYLPAFRSRGWPYCTVTVPDHSDGDIQLAAEYTVNAVRRIHAVTGRQVEMFGWSQGDSTDPRWALRFWPDIRPMVASLAGLAPDNEGGSNTGEGACALECDPGIWQEVKRVDQSPPHFISAMNSRRQTFAGVAYTVFYSLDDDLAGLNVITAPVSPLPPAPNVLNVAEQQLCSDQLFEHLTIPASSAGYAVMMAALATPGRLPSLAAIDRTAVCATPLMPFVTPASLALSELHLASLVPSRLTSDMVRREPPLRCYVYASGVCP
jgi:hypothetical protein